MCSSKSIVKYTKILDLFSLPFQFTLGLQEKQKKTLLGGVLSFLILALSFSYLVYLSNLYFDNQIQPTISTTNALISEGYEMEIRDNLIGFQIKLEDGEILHQIEARENKIYLIPTIIYTYFVGETKTILYFFTKPCTDPLLEGYLCIDFQSVNNNEQINKLKLRYKTNKSAFASINIVKCIDGILPPGKTCQTNEQIENRIFNIHTNFQVKTVLQQYNAKKRQYEPKIKVENFIFDDKLAFLSNFIFEQTERQIIEGFIIQNTNITHSFSGYTRVDSALSQSTILRQSQEKKLEIIGIVVFNIGQNNIIESIQYVQFTVLLAQFVSILNSLMVVGMIARRFAQTEIIQDLLNLQLKVYYKKTAQEIISSNEKNKDQKYQQNTLLNAHKSIEDANYQSLLTKYIKKGFISRLMILLFNKKNKQEQNDSKEMCNYKKLIQKSINQLDIYQIQKELLKIKIMIRLLFTAEQYAAIQLCGCSISNKNLLQNDKTKEVDITQNIIMIKDKEQQIDQESQNMRQSSIKEQKIEMIGYQDQSRQESNNKINVSSSLNMTIKEQAGINLENKPLDSNITAHQKELIATNTENHLEIIDQMDSDQLLLSNYLEQFLHNNRIPQNELNKRIIQSMINQTV